MQSLKKAIQCRSQMHITSNNEISQTCDYSHFSENVFTSNNENSQTRDYSHLSENVFSFTVTITGLPPLI